MSFDLIKVCVFGLTESKKLKKIQLPNAFETEADRFDITAFDTTSNLASIVAHHRPQVFITFGENQESFPELMNAPMELRKRWLHYSAEEVDFSTVAEQILHNYVANATERRFPDQPLVSVFTAAYRTGTKINRPLSSLLAQSYTNWEWVIYDDSPDDGKTFNELRELAQTDHRISVHRGDRALGSIGEVKRRACGLTTGDLLLELDHDDELLPHALSHLVEAHRTYPDAGFFYSDCADILESGENAKFPEGWGFGFGSYRGEYHNDSLYLVANSPEVNSKTIRHIVAAPNHFRAWTRTGYQSAGGFSSELHTCEDYELILRTFLTTRMCHIKKWGYIQYNNNLSCGNTQRTRNPEIQRLVRAFMLHYNNRIHERFVELGVDDFIWRDNGVLDWDMKNPDNAPYANYIY